MSKHTGRDFISTSSATLASMGSVAAAAKPTVSSRSASRVVVLSRIRPDIPDISL